MLCSKLSLNRLVVRGVPGQTAAEPVAGAAGAGEPLGRRVQAGGEGCPRQWSLCPRWPHRGRPHPLQ